MPYTPHQIQKAQKVADLTSGLVAAQLVLPKLFSQESLDQFKGTDGDTLTFRTPGRLPYREYGFRNDRTDPIRFDAFKEGKTTITVGGTIYSAIKVTDEQFEFDLETWAKPAALQADAVAQGVQDACASALENAPYNVTIGLDGSVDLVADLKRAFFEARRVMTRFRVPDAQRFAVVGTNVELIALDLAGTIAGRADAALGQGSIGKIAGFDVIPDSTIDPDAAYFFVPSAFVRFNAAPYVPQSVPFGTLTSAGDVKMRWLRDYDLEYKQDRSLFDTYVTASPVKDLLLKAPQKATGSNPVILEPADTPQFVRGIKLDLGATSSYPATGSDIAFDTGISTANAFAPTVTVTP